MSYAICPFSIVPIRASATDTSEMLSQLLFGEMAEILEAKGKQWTKIRCEWDNLVGWVATNQLKPITPSEHEHYNELFAYNLELMQAAMATDHFFPIPLGSQLPDFDGIRLNIGDETYTFSGQAVFPKDIIATAEFILKIARRYLHAPFLSGGRTPFGIDSAGLIQMVFKIAGIRLPREAAQQVYLGETIDFIEQIQAADLAFFEDRQGKIVHTGILMPNNQILHAFGKVRIDSLDHFGIYSHDENRYTHKLRVIKRMLPSSALYSTEAFPTAALAKNQIELF